jgi:hypothetical protein
VQLQVGNDFIVRLSLSVEKPRLDLLSLESYLNTSQQVTSSALNEVHHHASELVFININTHKVLLNFGEIISYIKYKRRNTANKNIF